MTSTQLDRIFGAQRIASTQSTVFGEEALRGTTHDHSWVLGVAFNHDGLAVGAVPGVGYSYNVPAAFAITVGLAAALFTAAVVMMNAGRGIRD